MVNTAYRVRTGCSTCLPRPDRDNRSEAFRAGAGPLPRGRPTRNGISKAIHMPAIMASRRARPAAWLDRNSHPLWSAPARLTLRFELWERSHVRGGTSAIQRSAQVSLGPTVHPLAFQEWCPTPLSKHLGHRLELRCRHPLDINHHYKATMLVVHRPPYRSGCGCISTTAVPPAPLPAGRGNGKSELP